MQPLRAPLIVVAILIIQTTSAAHPGPDLCHQHAEHLYQAGFYDQALTEYLRYLYWQPHGELRPWCLARAASCRRQLGEWDAAIALCRQGIRETNPGHLSNEFRLELARLYLDQSLASLADFTALQVLESSPSTCQEIQALALRIRAALDGGRFEDVVSRARLLLNTLRTTGGAPDNQVDTWHSQLEAIDLISTDRAVFLSRLVPGLGQLYAARPGRAINSLMANSAFGLTLVRSAISGDVGLTIFSTILLRRFNQGSRLDAARASHDRNRTLLQPVITALLRFADAAAGDGCGLFATSMPGPDR